jgi:glycosyltransferase involved in cell wall biosynthesis
MNTLPISVIIPTLNCCEKLKKHLEASQDWLPKVKEIIAIDSCSEDGTFDLLKEVIGSRNGIVIASEPGLYKSWNYAIQLASQPYIYISTICDIISYDGLYKLYNWIDKLKLDLIISTPKIISEDGCQLIQNWPIHRINFPDKLENNPWLPNSYELLVLSCAFLPESIIGSSASNLYRSYILKNNPFPENYGTVGDVLWCLKNLCNLKTGITTDEVATFLWDGNREGSWEKLCKIMDIIVSEFYHSLDDFPSELKTMAHILLLNFQALNARINNLYQYDEWSKTLSDKLKIIDKDNQRSGLKFRQK